MSVSGYKIGSYFHLKINENEISLTEGEILRIRDEIDRLIAKYGSGGRESLHAESDPGLNLFDLLEDL
jgi:hypothetical protein